MDVILSGLNATVLIRDAETQELLINFDPQVHELAKEATYIKKMELALPEKAVDLAVMEPRLAANIAR